MAESAPVASVYAEALHAVRSSSCTGQDRHRVGRPLSARIAMTVAGIALGTAAVAYFSAAPHLFAAPLGVAIGLVLLAGGGCEIRGEELRTTFWGFVRTARLNAVTRVTLGQVSGGEQLRLYVGSRRVGNLVLAGRRPVSADVRAHLVSWLNQPSVAWEPAAQAALGISDAAFRGHAEQAADLPSVRVNAGPMLGAKVGVLLVLGGCAGLWLAIQSSRMLAPGLGLTFAVVTAGVHVLFVRVTADPSGLTIRSLRGTHVCAWADLQSIVVAPGPWWLSGRIRTTRLVLVTRDGRRIRPLALTGLPSEPRLDVLIEYAAAHGVPATKA